MRMCLEKLKRCIRKPPYNKHGCQPCQICKEVISLANKANDDSSLSHTRWNCKYHIVFIPKYRRKEIYGKLRADIAQILKQLCVYKNVELIEGHAMSNHIHMLVRIPPKLAVSSFIMYQQQDLTPKQYKNIYKTKKKKI